MAKGYIYILTNPSFPDYVKIGYAKNVQQRVDELNASTAVPFAFRIYATYEVDSELSDKKLHSILDKLNPELRSKENINGKTRVREFYAMSPEDAYSILEAIAEINNYRNKLVKPSLTEKEAEDEAIATANRERLAPFKFSMCNIPIGAEIEFSDAGCPNSGEKCTVIDDNHVEYKETVYSLSSLATMLAGTKWPVAGPKYFKYDGEWLNVLRAKMENR